MEELKMMQREIIIVSGLPRSGTSMMMKMLHSGGIEVVTDNIRQADLDNPKGYYEYEKVKKIKEDSSWLPKMRGKAFKMVSMLLYDLPKNEKYKIIFMKRNMKEMLHSQKQMLERQKFDKKNVDYVKMERLYKNHLKEIEFWLKYNNLDVIYISYNETMRNLRENANNINRFLDNRLDIEKTISIVDTSLYRNRENNDININCSNVDLT